MSQVEDNNTEEISASQLKKVSQKTSANDHKTALKKSSDRIHSLEGTRYGVLEQKVKNMIDKQRKRQRSCPDKESTKKSSEKLESMHPNKKRRKFEKELTEESRVEDQSSNPTISEFVNDCTIYIQGLPFTCAEQQIRDFFARAGVIKSLRVPRWHDSGKLKGYGHVEFENEIAAQRALELNGEYLGDRYITVEKPMVPKSLTSSSVSKTRPAGCRTVFIRNLPYEVTEEEIRKSFMVYGPIQSVRLAVWNHTSNLKGFGYIEFKREDSAEIAVQKSGSIRIGGRIVTADYETAQPKRGYKGLRPTSGKK